MPGRIVFNTATNAAAPAERMRIDSNGSVGIKDNEFYIGTVNLNPGGGNGGGTFHWNTEVANSQSVNITPSIDYNTQKNGAMIVARIKSARRGATPTSTAWGEITGYYSSQGSNVSFIKKHGFNEGSGITLLDGTFKWVTSGSTAQIQYTADGDAYGEHLSIVGEFSNSYGSD
ncbi:MAG: hypothetical protein HYT73_04965 [Candidatus Aenigmarchaeota archaeon]|nr:hypothetical protein [Candidatus Aenigmarchaeota archaeon]